MPIPAGNQKLVARDGLLPDRRSQKADFMLK